MMILTLARDKRGQCVGLQLPATPADIGETYEKLDTMSTDDTKTFILRAETGVGSLDRWRRDRNVEQSDMIAKLNELAQKIDQMDDKVLKTFDGALTGAAFNNIADILKIADSLDEYIFVYGVTTEKELGRFLVDSGYKGFPESVLPYLDYEAIGTEYYAERGGAFTADGYTLRRGSAEPLVAAARRINAPVSEQDTGSMQSPCL